LSRVSEQRFHLVVEAFDVLRTKVLREVKDDENKVYLIRE